MFGSGRLLGKDPEHTAFNVYCSTHARPVQKLNERLIRTVTYFADAEATLDQTNTYQVNAVVNGKELEPGNPFTLAANSAARPYLAIPLMHDPQYRLAVAWQNVAWNQPPHRGFIAVTE